MDDLSFTGLEAIIYDEHNSDWPGEMDFYRELALQAHAHAEAVLELGCGTGRVAARLAEAGVKVTGTDLSNEMLDIAREKTKTLPGARWVQANMRSFDVGERFSLVLIPGHSFLFMLTVADQLSCLGSIYRHLLPGGVLVAHLDHPEPDWLGEIGGKERGFIEHGKGFEHPQTGNHVRNSYAWSYDRCTQVATQERVWEELGPQGEVLHRWDWEPEKFHCIFRYEMEHLLVRAGFEVLAVYGDFFKHELANDSEAMVWVAKRPTV